MLRAQRNTQSSWERACSRRGRCSPGKYGVWTKVFVSKLTPTKISVQPDTACSCDAERHEMHSHWSVRNDNRNYLVRRSASHAFPDAPRPLGDAERRELHSHTGACGAIIVTIVRRSASHAFPDALRPLGDAERYERHSPTLERAERSSQLSCGAPRRMPFRTLRVLLTTQSVVNCIPTLERAERSSQLSCGAPRRVPFWTLRVLLATQSVTNCIPTLEREERSS